MNAATGPAHGAAPSTPGAWADSSVRSILRAIGWKNLIWPVVAGTITLLSALALTVVSAWLITRSWQMPPIMDITVAVTAVRALGISRAIFRYTDRLASHQVALTTARKSRLALWQVLAGARNTAGLSRGSVLSRVGDDLDAVADVVVRSVIPALVAVLTSVVAVFFTALLSVPAAIVLAIGLVVAGVVAPTVIYRGVRASEVAHVQAAEEHSAAIERVLVDAPSLRIHGDLPKALADAQDTTMALARTDRSGAKAIAAGDAIATAATTLTAIATVVVALITYQAVGAGLAPAHSPEWLTVLVLIPLAAFESVSVLPGAAKSLARAQGSLSSLAELAQSAEEQPTAPAASPAPVSATPTTSASSAETTDTSARPHLRAVDLVTGYDHDLGTWNLDLPFGTRHQIVAPSGSGKTTLLKTLAGLIPARGGIITIDADGQEVPRDHQGGYPVRFIAEDEHIFATTIRDNIAIGNPSLPEAELHSLIDALGLTEWIATLPHGLDTVLTAGDDSLSGGQRRRLILTRALASPAPILLLDEPTEHMDTEADDILRLLLSQSPLPGLLPERTIVVVKHPRD